MRESLYVAVSNSWMSLFACIPLDDPEGEQKREQWSRLKGFLTGFTNPDGSLGGGLNRYAAPDDFRRQFEQHLRDRLDLLLEQNPPATAGPVPSVPEPPLWTEVPYPGLDVFTPEQYPIFFGRGPEIDQLIAGLSDPGVRFLAVVGVSGSGKSSLVAAGLIPRLRDGVVGGVPWRDLRFKPGERGGDPFLALAYALKAQLGTTGETERELADALVAGTGRFSAALGRLLDGCPAGSELLLVVDQFEELFTQSADTERERFLDWLHATSVLPSLRIVATLRADFYARAVREPVLASLLRRDRGSFPLDPPGPAALQEMIAGPARTAGLALEQGLVRQLLDDAGNNPGALALVAFTLHELYLKGGSAGRLTLSDYREIGGVSGAVRRRAEAVLGRLGAEVERGLDGLFTHLVEVNEQEVATRRRASKSRLEQGDGRLVDALTDAHLLVAGKGEGDAPTVEVAHEALLTAWPRLERGMEAHAESLRARRDLERAAIEWDTAGRPGSALRIGPLLKRYRGSAEPRSETSLAYLAACGRRVGWQKAGVTAAVVLVVASLGFFWHLSKSQYPPALAAQGLLVKLGVWPVNEPAMVRVSAGEFRMGDLAGDGFANEMPVHEVRFTAPFWFGIHEVTFDEYDLFAAATGREKPGDRGWGKERRPAINVDWSDAVAYAAWISKKIGKTYRLPSEAEWEYAARAGTVWKRYWEEIPGQEPDPACAHANVFDQSNESRIKATYGGINWEPFPCDDPFPFTAPVGEFIPNTWGLHDTLGNVWEWTQDCWHGDYEGAPEDGVVWEIKDCGARVVRGGSWGNRAESLRSAVRDRNNPGNRNDDLGFRLARSF